MGDSRRTRARGSYWNASGIPSNALFSPVAQFVFSGSATNRNQDRGPRRDALAVLLDATPVPRRSRSPRAAGASAGSTSISLLWRTWMPVRRSRSA